MVAQTKKSALRSIKRIAINQLQTYLQNERKKSVLCSIPATVNRNLNCLYLLFKTDLNESTNMRGDTINRYTLNEGKNVFIYLWQSHTTSPMNHKYHCSSAYRKETSCSFQTRVSSQQPHRFGFVNQNSLSLSDVAPELNRIELPVVCRCGQSVGVFGLFAGYRSPPGHPSATSDACAIVQNHHQGGSAANGKLV